MKDWAALITYLICKNITSSQQISRWLPSVYDALQGRSSPNEALPEFLSCVRQLGHECGISETVRTYVLQYSLWKDDASQLLKEIEGKGVAWILWNSLEMSRNLRVIPDFPIILYFIGNRRLLRARSKITLVGTRIPSSWGIQKAEQFACELSHCGVVTVSGLARGIDSVVFNKTLLYGGRTVAIVPTLEPEHGIWRGSKRVLLCSEYPDNHFYHEKWRYIARNRLLAALSSDTVIIEAPLRSGTLLTEELAHMYDKIVHYVLPGPLNDSNYGGVVSAISKGVGEFIQSSYDIFWFSNNFRLLRKYKQFIRHLSNQKIVVKQHDYRHLGIVDILKNRYATEKDVLELHHLGMILKRKDTAVFNFSGFTSWQRTSLLSNLPRKQKQFKDI